ncbi:MAG: hypothetical protein MUC65_03900 [Pontiellaceae bacterium]|jgi:hypothetical protein|nr:hypothetical protein [Pontiellaceae bacterium]
MKNLFKTLLRSALPGILLTLAAGCTTGTAVWSRPSIQPPPDNRPVSMDFTLSQSAEEVRNTIVKKGYLPKARTGATASIDQLIDPAVRRNYIGKTVPLERYDELSGSLCEVDLKFNGYFGLENIIVRHIIPSGNSGGLLELYLKHYPMLVFEGSETGENFNPEKNKFEKITNTNYHFDSGTYSFIHLNILRTYKDDGRYEETITFNAHDSNVAVQEACKHPCTAPPRDDSHEESQEKWEY